MIYIMTVAMVTRSVVAQITSNFIKLKQHTEYTLPVTSVQFQNATSKIKCATVCNDRNGFEPCAGFAFILINDQKTCALAIKVTMTAGLK